MLSRLQFFYHCKFYANPEADIYVQMEVKGIISVSFFTVKS